MHICSKVNKDDCTIKLRLQWCAQFLYMYKHVCVHNMLKVHVVCMLKVHSMHWCCKYNCTVYTYRCTVYMYRCTVYMYKCTVHMYRCTVYMYRCTVYMYKCTVHIYRCTVCMYTFTPVHCTPVHLYTVRLYVYTVHCKPVTFSDGDIPILHDYLH